MPEQAEIKGMLHTKFGGSLRRVTTPGIESIDTRSLSGLVEIIKSYIDVEAKNLNIQLPLIIQADGNEIKVLSSVDDTYERQILIHCKPIVPRLILNEWISPEEMIINLNTCYVPTDNTDKLISTVSNLYNSKTVKQVDNGIGVNLVVESDAFAGGAGKVTINQSLRLHRLLPILNLFRWNVNLIFELISMAVLHYSLQIEATLKKKYKNLSNSILLRNCQKHLLAKMLYWHFRGI